MFVDLDDADPGDARLADALRALADPVRLALLRQLRVPKALNEIRVRPVRGAARAGSPQRNLARQSVKQHLEPLLRIGAVEVRDADRAEGARTEYVLNHQALFSLSEEFRGLARLRPAAESARSTVPDAPTASPSPARGPCVVLVKGLEEGRAFDLAPPAGGTREWVLGRKRGVDISLDFDPYVSSEHALIVWERGQHHIVDIPESRNGTTLNFQTLPRGARKPLRTGDVIGVGRVLLLYRG